MMSVRPIWWLLMLLSVLPLQPTLLGGCAHNSLRDDDDDYGYDDEDDADDEGRSRRRRGKKTKKAPVLVDYRRLSDAVVEVMASGRPRDDIDDLRSSRCEDNRDDPVIFYQFVVGRHWHFYWLCSESKPIRAASPEGNRILLAWVKQISRRAAADGAACSPGSSRRLFKQSHESGTKAKAYCDGRIVLEFADGGTKTRRFIASVGGSAPAPIPSPGPSNDPGRSVCPACPVCPKVQTRSVDCEPPRPCPPPRRCPPAPTCPAQKPCDCKPQMRAAGEKGFWQGVKKACQRICTLIYKKCRKIDPKTAMCYQVSEYCAENCAKK